MAVLANVRIRAGIDSTDTSKDVLLTLAISDAEAFFKSFTRRTVVVVEAVNLVERLAALLYLRSSSGNVQSEKLGDHSVTNFSGTQDLPDSLLTELRSYRKLVVL